MFNNLPINYSFKDLAYNTKEANWSIVRWIWELTDVLLDKAREEIKEQGIALFF